jgi:predicted nucleic acid-binding protein
MKSLDTNILIYASNEDGPEHRKARDLVESLLDDADDWIIADQVLIETYRALRNPAVLQHPLGADEAWALVHFYREEAGCRRFDARRTFDAVLATTLIANAVDSFYTRNTKDFKEYGFSNLINPID